MEHFINIRVYGTERLILFSIYLGSLYTVMSLATLPLGFFFIYTAWKNIATEVHLLDNYITNALK